MAMTISRRLVLQAGAAGASLAAMGRWRVSEASGPPGDGTYADAWPALDRFVEQYMREMNAPGMALVLADRDGVQRVAHYGFSDFESKDPPQEDTLFAVGSISKSFVALALLQLRDEGKLDLDRPLVEYLPWLRVESRFAPVTTHHLLTHTTGLPGAGDVFQADPELRHLAAYAPGEHFHYNNAMYDVLGILAWTLDGRELPELLRERILRPLGMDRSEPAITLDVRERLAKSYSPFLADRPYARHGKLCEAPGLIATGGAGCADISAGVPPTSRSIATSSSVASANRRCGSLARHFSTTSAIAGAASCWTWSSRGGCSRTCLKIRPIVSLPSPTNGGRPAISANRHPPSA
jgi:CubicO group peptidase (beta-lactamase class C family)